MVANPYENYKRMQIETASPGRLLLLLYDGALKNLRVAQECVAQRKINQAHNCLIKAQNIIMELNLDLNMDAGGDIAHHLRSLYVYNHKRLIEANVKKDATIIQEVIDVMAELKEGWETIILKNRPDAMP
ncbi:MAG: flagellar export chaperone FliS [Negativicutes bacterium]|nr:flagellar export chaperone FliS [Negativicutes bacterium]